MLLVAHPKRGLVAPGRPLFAHIVCSTTWGQSELTIDRMIIQKGLSGTNSGRVDDVVGHQLFSNAPASVPAFLAFFRLPRAYRTDGFSRDSLRRSGLSRSPGYPKY